MTPVRLVVRSVRRSTLVWVYAAAALVAVGVESFDSLYKTEASRAQLTTQLGDSKVFSALYGHAVAIDTPGGFIAWKYGGSFLVLIGLWAVLTVTRIMRGDEERGRTDLLVAAPLSIRGLIVGQLVVMGGAVALLGVAVALAGLVTGLPVGGSILLGLMLTSAGFIFAAVAAITSQLMPTRRQASGLAGALLGGSYLVRVVATGTNHYWLSWCTPLGWADRISPFSDPSSVAVALVLVVPVALGIVALWLRGRRDTGEGIISPHDAGASRGGPPTSLLVR